MLPTHEKATDLGFHSDNSDFSLAWYGVELQCKTCLPSQGLNRGPLTYNFWASLV